MRRFGSLWLALALCLCLVQPALAEDYPTKPVTIVVPWGPGGMADVSGRLLAEKFKELTGQPFLVVNKPGATGLLGLKYTLGQAPDGYTVALGLLTDAVTSPLFQEVEPFNLDQVSFVAGYMAQARVLFAKADAPYKTFPEFVEYARKNPGKVSVGSGASQFAMEIVKSVAVKEKLDLKYVMFKSGGEASTAILGGHVDVCETGTGTPAFQAAREGKLRILVNLGTEAVPFFPDTKTVKSLGYPYASLVVYGIVAPKGTPEPVRQKLENLVKQALADPKVAEAMTNTGLAPEFLTGKAYEAKCREAVAFVPALIKNNKALQ